MKLINRKSKELLNYSRRTAEQQFFISVRGTGVFFTASAVSFCEITAGSSINFLNEGSEWCFYVDDSEDGFKVECTSVKESIRDSFRINSTGLVRMILTSTGFKKEKRFAVEKTEMYHDRCRIFRLSTENVPTVIR